MCISLLSPKMDFIFKKIFGNEKDKSVLISFLNAALKPKEAIVDVELRNVEITKEAIEDKNSRLDVKAITNDKTIINVEIQLHDEYNMSKRTLYYWSKLYSDQLKEGQDYKLLNKTVCINILDFNHLKEIEEYHSIFKVREEKTNVVLDESLEIHFLELPKLKGYNEKDPLTGWGMFLKEPSSDVVEEAEEEIKEIKKAKKQLFVISADEEERERYLMREMAKLDGISALAEATRRGIEEGIEKGREEGIEKGREEGIKKEKEQNAKKMLEEGIAEIIISKITGLSEKEIKKLK